MAIQSSADGLNSKINSMHDETRSSHTAEVYNYGSVTCNNPVSKVFKYGSVTCNNPVSNVVKDHV